MQIRARRDAFTRDLEEGSRPERPFKFLEIGQTRLLCGRLAQQCPERSTVNGTTGGVIPERKDQGLDIGPPACMSRQVETARPRPDGLTRRKISHVPTSPISQPMFVSPIRVTIAAVKAPAPPRNGVAANSTSS